MGLITKSKGAPRASNAAPSDSGAKYICNVCSNDITSTVRIRCASKQCNDYDLCVPCFSQGSSNLYHDPHTHSYQVIEPHSVPIFDESWGADEELLLLEGCEQYGLGSWADIADHIGGYREKDEVRDHYIATYVASPNFPLPARASPGDKRLSDSIPRDEFQARKKRRIELHKQAIAENASTAPVPAKPTSSVPSCHEVAGYMPARLEFENEYFNEAEEAVQHMQFAPDEGINPDTKMFDPETDLKMTVMSIYNDRLTQRTDRKRIIFNHRLLEYRKNTALDKKRTKEQRDLHGRLKPFARIMSHPDFDTFCDDLEKEQNLRQAISQLQDWRRMRISTLAAGQKYEEEKLTRQARNTQPVGAFDRMANGIRGSNKPATAPEVATAVTDYTTKELPVRLSSSIPMNAGLQTPPAADLSPKYAPLPPIATISAARFDEDSAPDWQLITIAERDLCNKLRIQPKAWLAIKHAIMACAMQQDGKIKKKDVRAICKLDTTKGGKIFEFCLQVGWIQNGAR